MKQLRTIPAKDVIRIALVVAALLVLPLTLTLLNSHATIYAGGGGGWDWMPGDFVVMGALLFITGLAMDFAVRNLTKPAYRVAAVAVIAMALFLVWIELAVDGVSQLLRFLLI